MQKKEGLSVLTGNAFLYYCHDVGTDIDLDEAARLLGSNAERVPLSVERISHGSIKYRKNPLLVRLGQIPVTGSYSVEAVGKIFDFGVVTLRLRIPLHGTLDEKLCGNFHNKFIEQAAKEAFERLRSKIECTIIRPYDEDSTFEGYTIIHVERLSSPISGAALFSHHANDIARMLRSDANDLSTMELNDVIRNPVSYYADELVVIDADVAFIYSPRHEYDVHDVIEYAIIELLELRHYDSVLDNVLERAHSDISTRSLRLKPVSKLHRELSHVRIEVTDVVEKVENSLKLVGDIYLAKIYNTASERFGLPRWKESVRDKLQTLQSVYTMLTERISANRLMLLEIIVAISSAMYLIEFIIKYLWKG